MTKHTEVMKLAQELRALADRFSEGWYEGIKIDASDIVLLSDAAEALAEQPAPATELREQEPGAGWDSIEAVAAARYKVVPSHDSMFYRHAVVAGNGTQQLYVGHELECENMARKFAGAFLDGAFVMQGQTSPQAQPAQRTWVGLTDEEIERCMKQAYATVQGRNLEHAFARAIEAKLREKNT